MSSPGSPGQFATARRDDPALTICVAGSITAITLASAAYLCYLRYHAGNNGLQQNLDESLNGEQSNQHCNGRSIGNGPNRGSRGLPGNASSATSLASKPHARVAGAARHNTAEEARSYATRAATRFKGLLDGFVGMWRPAAASAPAPSDVVNRERLIPDITAFAAGAEAVHHPDQLRPGRDLAVEEAGRLDALVPGPQGLPAAPEGFAVEEDAAIDPEAEEEAEDDAAGAGGHVNWKELLDEVEDELEVPDEFKDPISLNVMLDPVILCATGQVYEYTTLKNWFRTGNRLCPKTNIEVLDVQVVRVPWLKARIHEWLQQHGRGPTPQPDATERLARLHSSLAGWVHSIRNDTGERRSAALADLYELLRQWEVATVEPPEDDTAAGTVAVAASEPDSAVGGSAELASTAAAAAAAAAAEPATAGPGDSAAGTAAAGAGAGAGGSGRGGRPCSAAARAAAMERLHRYVRGSVMDEAIWLLRYGSPYLQGVAASILAYCDSPGEVSWLAAVAGVPAVSLCMSQNRYSSQAATRLLYNLARGGQVARRVLVGAGAVTALISVLATDRQEYGYCRDRAAATLALLIRDTDGKSLLLLYGLPHLVAMVRSGLDRWEQRDAATVLLKLGLEPERLEDLGLTSDLLVSYWCCSRAWLDGAVDDPTQGYLPAEHQVCAVVPARQAVEQLRAGTLTHEALAMLIADQDADLDLTNLDLADADDPWEENAHVDEEAAVAWRLVEANAQAQLSAAAERSRVERLVAEERRRRDSMAAGLAAAVAMAVALQHDDGPAGVAQGGEEEEEEEQQQQAGPEAEEADGEALEGAEYAMQGEEYEQQQEEDGGVQNGQVDEGEDDSYAVMQDGEGACRKDENSLGTVLKVGAAMDGAGGGDMQESEAATASQQEEAVATAGGAAAAATAEDEMADASALGEGGTRADGRV
ncbi:hypothetical protein VOLCADRAFT_121440 [Volvox carteri f. nagariensis]|uniref:RING-type E3 ubiquitin transferase n=1 Tax=Volvox carteri f. nagariensis TaxID=3068 RepID=D8UA75_VOLCA|nr:uncharacterized protein VOLCADRAFT_121440 [Volvox carteri f. nagariensis]EFJ43376.1 hypothetical protein VOLCADRAFT_121440 [Volvox carteri f. nagariensis]|eukprot:XP_002955523.1 hypothetical protein VOLCADRAFT_121440 [Volvox carteri f. nagariensis]